MTLKFHDSLAVNHRTRRAADDFPLGHIHTTNKKLEYTMIPEKLQNIMKKDGVVAIATLGSM